MTVTRVDKDPDARTMTLRCEYDADVERVWRLWADPRRLERWWGPPGAPATVVEHDLVPGGTVSLYVTSPDGERFPVSWSVRAVDPPHALAFDFDDPRVPPLAIRVALAERPGGGTRMTIETSFPSGAAMDELLALGFDQGLSSAVGQIDGVLAEAA